MEKKCYLSPKQYQSGAAGLSLKQGTMVYHRNPDFCPILYGYQWSSDGSTCYRYGHHLTWNEASAACQEHGGRLMQVETAHKNSVIVEIIEDNNAGGMLFVFFGMVDYESEGTPRWADGSQISGYENWAPGSQDSAQEECGIYHRKNPSQELQWEDQYCAVSYDYICEVVLD
ncbi:snaclec coagulation factor IX-binding protein subunit A-like [Haliotis cracherodii]|uniref:snaclec coagulation factor IX-binding protein subunit A-like n=1 Tax=Haliotis cracherodii TaxID=6455 RepID=UPI0039E7A930